MRNSISIGRIATVVVFAVVVLTIAYDYLASSGDKASFGLLTLFILSTLGPVLLVLLGVGIVSQIRHTRSKKQ